MEWRLPEAWEGRKRNPCLRATESQFHKMERILEIDGGDGCTVTWIYASPLNCTLKNSKGEGGLGLSEKGGVIKKYMLVVIKQPWRYTVQRREYKQ